MNENRFKFAIVAMAKVFKVSRSGFYDWCSRMAGGDQKCARTTLDEQVRIVFARHRGRYGAPRITKELSDQGHCYNRKTVANSLRRQGLRARAGRRFKPTTNSDHKLPVAANLLEQDFSTCAINQKWVQDITYLGTDEGWLYLATVIDLHNRQVIGWAMDKHMKANLVCDALTMALWRRKMPTDVIVHSDRGGQYCSSAFQKLIKQHRLRCSMSKRGDCYDNACAETFFHTLKVELTHGKRYARRVDLKREVFEYIETYYNTVRRHSALGYLSPIAYAADGG